MITYDTSKINYVNGFCGFVRVESGKESLCKKMKMKNLERFVLFLFEVFYLVPVSRLQDLTIDNQLVIVANDCYTRVSIGTRLPKKDISLSAQVNSVSDCEEECSKRRNVCVAFSFGIGVKGNATCILSSELPNPDDLQDDPDYDIYLRSQRSPHCESDRLFKSGNNVNKETKNNTRQNSRFAGGLFGSILPNIYQPTRSEQNGQKPNTTQQTFISSFDDQQRIMDIVRNKNLAEQKYPIFNNYNDPKLTQIRQPIEKKPQMDTMYGEKIYLEKDKPNAYEDLIAFGRPVPLISRPIFDNIWQSKYFENYGLGSHGIFSNPIDIYDKYTKNEFKAPNEFGFSLENGYSETSYTNRNKNAIIKNHQSQTTVFPSTKETQVQNSSAQKYWNDGTRLTNQNFGGNNYKNHFNEDQKNHRVGAKEEKKPCYRKLLNGKKTAQIHVRRALECQRLEECHRACDYEKYFPCQGFNYRRMGSGSRGMCEMTSVPYSRMDIHRDFVIDPQCDYYDKDPDCPRDTGNRPSWSGYPSRPGETYIPGSGEPPGRPFNRFRPNSSPYGPERRPPSDIPRPIDYDQRPVYHKLDAGRPIDLPRPIDNKPQVYGSSYGSFDEPFYQRPVSSPDGRPIDNYNGNGYSYGRPQYSRPMYNVPIGRPYPSKMYPDRRVDYNPYNDIGTNEIGPYSPDRRKDHRDWPVYGSSYGYDTHYVGQFDIPKYYPKHPPQDNYQPARPQEDDHSYGEFYNYGSAFGYGDNYIPPIGDRDQFYGGTKKDRRCTVRAGVGVKLGRSVVRKTCLTPNMEECENLCLNEKSFLCMTLAYRYNVAPTDPTDNCVLSEVSYKELNFYTDLEPNRDYDIYAIIGDSRTCGMIMQQHHHPPDECFWRVRSGFGMPSDVIRKSISVDDLGECQMECTVAPEFTCRSFAFKYGLGSAQRTPTANCFLSDWPTQEINPTTMPDMDGAELYERGSFGRGCEPYPFPPFKIGGYSKFPRGENVCYSGYHKPCRLTPYSVMFSMHANSENECRERCSKMRQRDPTPCMSFSYKIRADRGEQNCLFSDVSIRDLRPGLDYSYDDGYMLYAWKDLEPQCIVTGYSIDDNHVFNSPGHGHERPLPPPPPGRPDLGPGSDQSDGIYIPDPRPFYGHDVSRPFDGHDVSRPFDIGPHHGLRPYDPDRPDPSRPNPARPPVDRPYGPPGPPGGHSDYGNNYGFNFQGPYEQDNNFPPSPDFSTFQHYTVNGYPCKRGTKCERNNVVGFWSCETDGGEFGSWDYCCEPNHHCGYSQGYHYPWCYVGISVDQWRPCSEKYYPYLSSSRPTQYGDHHGDHHRDPTDPNYFARHWPVTYLHKEPPPNCTDSLASADNARDRRLNQTSFMTRSKEEDSKNEDRSARLRDRAIRRLRSRTLTTNNTENVPRVSRRSNDEHDGRILFSGKIDAQLATDTASSNSERFGKIERITKSNSNLPHFNSMPIVVPFVTKQNGNHMERSMKMAAPTITANHYKLKEFENFTSYNNFTVPKNLNNSAGTAEGFVLRLN